ncbi:MAG TPA: RNA polymerase sigma factor, partial [Acidimicrobiales bacterium]|nr:RNA polymerase sigma factor [Acidimicrobiales bacterium]
MALRQDEVTSLCDDVDLDRDRALVERCQAGDSAAFGNLYARYYERLLRFCMRRLSDRHEAEDAAQEAFARAWKALPNFAGERRFYPWLTVIAGNICTDMLRRRSRSTPTDDFELTAQNPVGVTGADTSEELVLAAVDGELVTKALDRLSVRHRHVLAMREGSGWTYQQIADHEGVEIGTIETLLWRARQALKREFTVLSDSKGALAGVFIGAGSLIRRTVFRVAHRSASLQGSGMGGGLRNAMAGVAVTSAAVAAAIITPTVLSSPKPTVPSAIAAPSNGTIADPNLPLAAATTPATTPADSSSDGSGVVYLGTGGGGGTGSGSASSSNASASTLRSAAGLTTGSNNGANPTAKIGGDADAPVGGGSPLNDSPLSPITTPVINGLSPALAPVVGTLSQATTGLEN